MPQQIEVPGMGMVEFPDGMSDADISAAIRRSMPQQPTKPIDPTEGMSGTDKFMAGVGKAFYDAGRGVGTLVTDAIPGAAKYGFSTRKDVDEAKRLDAPLMNTWAGMAGNLTGNIVVHSPLAMIPGAATIGGGTLIGGATGLTQAAGVDDSRLQNAAIGGATGGVVPAAIRAAKVLRAVLADPFTFAGQTKIAGSLINRSAANPAAVAERLRTAKGATPGFTPTVGQAAGDAGVGALERTIRAIDPKVFDEIDKSQLGALVEALRSVAQTPEAKAAQLAKVEETARELYGKALKENVTVTPDLAKLASRPSMRRAEARAVDLAAEQSTPFQARLKDMQPQYIPIKSAPTAPSFVLEKPKTNSLGMIIDVPEQTIPAQARPSSYFEIPPVDSVPVRDMHTLKMGMDALMADPTLGIAGREAKAINRTRNQLLDLLPESYQTARKAHIELNKPAHQMDIGQELYKRFTPALADQGGLPFKSTAQSFANALREGDELAKNVTGMKNAKLAEIMTPEQMSLLQGVAKDSATKAAAEVIGKGGGSDSIQKASMSNIAAEAGVPNWLSSIARVPGGWAKRAGDVLYGSSDEQIRARLAELLRNPEEAAQSMQAAGATPSKMAEFLKKGAQGLGLSTVPAIQGHQQ